MLIELAMRSDLRGQGRNPCTRRLPHGFVGLTSSSASTVAGTVRRRECRSAVGALLGSVVAAVSGVERQTQLVKELYAWVLAGARTSGSTRSASVSDAVPSAAVLPHRPLQANRPHLAAPARPAATRWQLLERVVPLDVSRSRLLLDTHGQKPASHAICANVAWPRLLGCQ
jgi:hypothetical protein